MRVIKNINNNVCLCLDDNGNEAVVFGKGLGFKKPPYEIEDLKLIDKTYYNINANYMKLFNEIPESIFLLTDKVIEYAETKYGMIVNSNLLMTLADHINFIIVRSEKGYDINYTSFYNLRYMNRDAYDIGVYAVDLIQKKMKITLLRDEEYGIAMYFIDAMKDSDKSPGKRSTYTQSIIDHVLEIIENFFDIKVDKDSFDYLRFINHINYLLADSQKESDVDDDYRTMYEDMVREFPDIYQCVCQIGDYFLQDLDWELNKQEKMYLMLHISRLCRNK